MKNNAIDNAVVLILGASGGLGKEIARVFAGAGARLALAGRNGAVLSELAQALPAQAFLADITDRESLTHLRNELIHQYGHIDYIVNAAGCDVRKPLKDHLPAELERTVRLNLLGPMQLTQVFLPVMQTGLIVHVGAFGDGRLAFPYYTADSATRAGLASFVEAMNRELSLEGSSVRLLFFSPAPADTPAERPYHPIWKEMGLKVYSSTAVAKEMLQAVQRGETLHIMGGPLTVFFSRLNAVFPNLADTLMMNHYGKIQRRYFTGEAQQPRPRSAWTIWLGMTLVILSFVFYGVLPVLPFVPLPAAARLALAPVLIALGEAAFWVGGILLGKEMIRKMKEFWLCAWNCFRRNAP